MNSSSGSVWMTHADQAVCMVLIAGGLAALLLQRYQGGSEQNLTQARQSERGGPPPFLVDVNQAAWPELALLPGIGPTLARRIVADRDRHGPFAEPEDLLRVRGIGPRKLAKMRPHLVVSQPSFRPPHSSTASRGPGRGTEPSGSVGRH